MRTIFIKLKTVGVILSAVTAVMVITTFVSSGALSVMKTERDLPIYCVDKLEKVLSLTFDAAWGNEDTQTIIDILDRYKVSVTFFVVGDWARKYPESVKALYEAGHEVMSHSNHHDHMTKLSAEQIQADIKASCDSILAATGASEMPNLFRPPYGEYDNKVIGAVKAMGIYPIQWDVDSLDWKNLSAAEIQKRILTRINPGSIILCHNGAQNITAALPGVIEGLQKQGYNLIKVSELIYYDNYNIDHTGKQILNKGN